MGTYGAHEGMYPALESRDIPVPRSLAKILHPQVVISDSMSIIGRCRALTREVEVLVGVAKGIVLSTIITVTVLAPRG